MWENSYFYDVKCFKHTLLNVLIFIFSRQYDSMASGELEVLRCESSLWSGHCCARCRAELGRIINRGANCRACRERICMSCREYSTATHAPEWLCIRCHKEKIEYVFYFYSVSMQNSITTCSTRCKQY